MSKKQIRNKIFDILKEIREGEHHGSLIVFSDTNRILQKGVIPIGKADKEFNELGNINDESASKIIKKIDDGAILIGKNGSIYHPPVYINISTHEIDQSELHPEYCARHIAALATSASTKAHVFTLSEETGRIREFVKGKKKREFPDRETQEVLNTIQKDIIKAKKGILLKNLIQFKNIMGKNIKKIGRKKTNEIQSK